MRMTDSLKLAAQHPGQLEYMPQALLVFLTLLLCSLSQKKEKLEKGLPKSVGGVRFICM